MLQLEDIDAFLKDGGIEELVWYGGIPDDTGRNRPPTRLHAILDTGGLPMTVERAFDRPTFQVISRAEGGRQAREIAYAVHDLIVDADIPFTLGGEHVIDTGRVGGSPTELYTDDSRRVYYGANYWLEMGRGVM